MTKAVYEIRFNRVSIYYAEFLTKKNIAKLEAKGFRWDGTGYEAPITEERIQLAKTMATEVIREY